MNVQGIEKVSWEQILCSGKEQGGREIENAYTVPACIVHQFVCCANNGKLRANSVEFLPIAFTSAVRIEAAER